METLTRCTPARSHLAGLSLFIFLFVLVPPTHGAVRHIKSVTFNNGGAQMGSGHPCPPE